MSRGRLVLLCNRLVLSLEGEFVTEKVLLERMVLAREIHLVCIGEKQRYLERAIYGTQSFSLRVLPREEASPQALIQAVKS